MTGAARHRGRFRVAVVKKILKHPRDLAHVQSPGSPKSPTVIGPTHTILVALLNGQNDSMGCEPSRRTGGRVRPKRKRSSKP